MVSDDAQTCVLSRRCSGLVLWSAPCQHLCSTTSCRTSPSGGLPTIRAEVRGCGGGRHGVLFADVTGTSKGSGVQIPSAPPPQHRRSNPVGEPWGSFQGKRLDRSSEVATPVTKRSRPAATNMTVTSCFFLAKPIFDPSSRYTWLRSPVVGAAKNRPPVVLAIRRSVVLSGGTGAP